MTLNPSGSRTVIGWGVPLIIDMHRECSFSLAERVASFHAAVDLETDKVFI